jgi:hypothetical protein
MSRNNSHQDLIAQLKKLGIHISNETEAKINLSFIDYLNESTQLKEELVSKLADLQPETLSQQDRQTLELLEHLIIS